MRSGFAIILAALALFSATPASAQFGGLLLGKTLGLPKSGEAGGEYQSNNQIRTFASARPYDAVNLFDTVLVKAAEMTAAKGFSVLGVTKTNCSTMLMNGSPVAKSCYLIAIVLNDGDKASPRGKHSVRYFNVSDVRAGTLTPLHD